MSRNQSPAQNVGNALADHWDDLMRRRVGIDQHLHYAIDELGRSDDPFFMVHHDRLAGLDDAETHPISLELELHDTPPNGRGVYLTKSVLATARAAPKSFPCCLERTDGSVKRHNVDGGCCGSVRLSTGREQGEA